MKTIKAALAALLLCVGVAGCTIHFGPDSGCNILNPKMTFEHGHTTVVSYHVSCDAHPRSIKGAIVVQWFNKGNHKWEGAAKKVITLNSIPPADGKSYPYKFSGNCFPNTREHIHIYATSTWSTGPDHVNKYVPTYAGVATKGCGQAHGQH